MERTRLERERSRIQMRRGFAWNSCLELTLEGREMRVGVREVDIRGEVNNFLAGWLFWRYSFSNTWLCRQEPRTLPRQGGQMRNEEGATDMATG